MEHKFCKDTAVECRFHKKGHPCSECVDITEATNFLLKELKPKSGTLKTGVMNNDYAAYLMTVFSKQFCQADVKLSLPEQYKEGAKCGYAEGFKAALKSLNDMLPIIESKMIEGNGA